MAEMLDSIEVAALWNRFCETPTYRQAVEWAQAPNRGLAGINGALFVAFRDGLREGMREGSEPKATTEGRGAEPGEPGRDSGAPKDDEQCPWCDQA